jgi:fibronectin type 3 domain-containing protein
MAGTPPGLNPDLLEALELARKGRRALEAAGVSMAFWEACRLAQAERSTFRRAMDRLSEGVPIETDLFEKLRLHREQGGPLLQTLREFLSPDTEDPERREMLLGFIAISPAALDGASRWVGDPDRYREESARKVRLMEGVVEKYRVAMDSAPPKAEAPLPPPLPPPAPAAPAALAGNRTISLSWAPSPGATRYTVKRSFVDRGPYAPVGTTPECAFRDGDLENGKVHRYVVTAANDAGESAESAETSATPLAPPPAPGGLKAAAGNALVTLSWEAVEGATGYVLRCTPPGPAQPLATLAETTYVHRNARNGTTYAYTVCATNAGGEGPASPAVEAVPLDPPEVPAGLSATPGNGRIALSWSPVPGATHYTLERAAAAIGPYTRLVRTSQTFFTDATAQNGTPLFYTVRAEHAAGESIPCSPVESAGVAPPPAPAGLTAVPGNAQVMLSWTASPGAARYRIHRATTSALPHPPLAETSETTCVDARVTNGTEYFYSVVAFNAGGQSDPSEMARARPVAPPPAPAKLAAWAGDGRVTLTWDPSERASRYRVRRAAARSGPYTRVAQVSEPRYVDTHLTNGKDYYYIVTAINLGGHSAHAGPVQATPLAAPAAPSATPGAGRIALAWPPSAGALSYHVLRSETPGGPHTLIATTTGNSFDDGPLSDGRTYCYAVCAVNANGESPLSPEIQATPREAPPASPPARPPAAAPPAAGAAAVVDPRQLEDLRRVEALRGLFVGMGQRIETWEVLCLIARDGAAMRRTIDRLLALKEGMDPIELTEGLLSLYEKLLRIRTEEGPFVQRLAVFADALDLGAFGARPLELALGILVAAPEGRRRAEQWLADPGARRHQAREHLERALLVALHYVRELASP